MAYMFGNNWKSQTSYKLLALLMLFIGGLATYTFVWNWGDIGIRLMTVFNMIAILPMSGQASGHFELGKRNSNSESGTNFSSQVVLTL